MVRKKSYFNTLAYIHTIALSLYCIVCCSDSWSLCHQYGMEEDPFCSELYPVRNLEVFLHNMIWKKTFYVQHYMHYRILKPSSTLYSLDEDFFCTLFYTVQNTEGFFNNIVWEKTSSVLNLEACIHNMFRKKTSSVLH